MVPGTAIALLLVLVLVPGWVFLRATEQLRRPRNLTPLLELLEVVAVGLATTGLAAAFIALVCTESVRSSLSHPLSDDRHLRGLVILIADCLIGATVLAGLAALVWAEIKPVRFKPGVWEAIFSPEPPEGTIRHVTVELLDGRTVAGQLIAYTTGSDGGPQQVALTDKIWAEQRGGTNRERTTFNHLIVDSSNVIYLGMSYERDPGATRQEETV